MAAIGDDNALEDQLTPETKAKCQKHHSRLDLSRTDMLQLLSHLETELQARDVVITTLKAEKAKHFLYQAKYGRFGLTDPLYALQRDSESDKEATMKAIYEDPLTQLDKLVSTQHKAQQQMKDQLNVIDQRYHKVCVELQEERWKHNHDLEQGDSVVFMLEKDRERLHLEVELEKKQNKEIELELEKVSNELDKCARHKEVVLMLIKKRSQIVKDIVETQMQRAALEERSAKEEGEARAVQDRLSEESSRSQRLEMAADKQLGVANVEREQLLARLALVERQNAELYVELERLRSAVGTRSKRNAPSSPSVSAVDGVPAVDPGDDIGAVVNARHVHAVASAANSSSATGNARHPLSKVAVSYAVTGGTAHPLQRAAATSVEAMKFSSSGHTTIVDRQAAVTASDVRVIVPSASDSSPCQFPAEPPGTRISVGVSGPLGGQAPRKQAPVSVAGRGVPPPIPPNKPQVTVTQSRLLSASSNPVNRAVAATTAQPSRSSQPQLKFGVAFSQSDRSSGLIDKPSGGVGASSPRQAATASPSSSQTNANHVALVVGETTAVHKHPSQVCVNIK